MGLNVLQVVNTINEKTRDFPGMKVPVKVEVDTETKQFTVEVGIPPTAALSQKKGGSARDPEPPEPTMSEICQWTKL